MPPGEATVGIGQAARLKTSGSSRMRTPEPRFGWGPVNIPIEPNTLVISRERARGYLNTRDRLYCVDELRVGIRSIASMCASSVHGHNIVFQWGRLIPAYCKLCD
jgi:hypothetical protein